MRGSVAALIAVGIFLSSHYVSAEGQQRPSFQLVDNFDHALQNALGGYRSAYAAQPSRASVGRVSVVRRGVSGSSLHLDAERGAGGFCGAWIHLFDFRAARPRFFDGGAYDYLTFWIRGTSGGESIDVRLADRRWINKEDSVRVGAVAEFLAAQRVTTEWQEAVIPLRDLAGIDLQELGGVTFDVAAPGKVSVFLEDLAFVRGTPNAQPRADLELPEAPEPPEGEIRADNRRMPRALWVWNTAEILADAQQTERLWEFCEAEGISGLWMQIGYRLATPRDSEARPGNQPRRISCQLQGADLWRPFLRAAHRRGLQVHALDGDPELAVRARHAVPLAVVEAIIAWNRAAPASERFAGIHFDHEPYLLLGWSDPVLRERILEEYLELHVACQERVSDARPLIFGADLPFWWHASDGRTGRPIAEVTFRGRRQAASLHCLDWLDYVAIMNYRDVADGPDGMLAHARALVAHASQPGKARVFLGMETTQPPPVPVWFSLGGSREAFAAALRGEARQFGDSCRIGAARLHILDDGQRVHVGVALPASGVPTSEHIVGMRQVAQRFGTRTSKSDSAAAREACDVTRRYIEQSGEWEGLRPLDVSAGAADLYPGFVVHSVMPSKVTFGDDRLARFRQEWAEAEFFLRDYAGFAGWALHDLRGYERLVRSRE